MPVLIAILGFVTAISVWYWRYKRVSEAADEVIDLAKTAVNLPRRLRFLQKTRKNGLALVQDPRDAATVLMLEVAKASGGLTLEHQGHILHLLQTELDMEVQEAEETMVNAGWISKDAPSSQHVVEKMTQVIAKSDVLGETERQGLYRMMINVAEIGQPCSPQQQALIDLYITKGGLAG